MKLRRNKKRTLGMIWLRRTTQVVSLLFFMFLLTAAALPGSFLIRVVDIYPRTSPLLFAATWLNTFHFPIAFIPAIAAIGATLIFGRFFCGWVCPLGVTFDATDKWLGPRKKRDDSIERLHWKPVKYAVLIVTLFAAYFEANIAGWLDPLSFATKLYSLVLLPGAEFAGKLALNGLKPIPGVGLVTDKAFSILNATVFASEQRHYHGMIAVFLIYLAAALLVWINRRFWCRFLCPAGAIFALFSRFSLYKRVVDQGKCIRCGRCMRTCRMGAITGDCAEGFRGECIECFTCKQECPVGAISFRPRTAPASDKRPIDFSRRNFLASLAGAAVTVPLVRIAPGNAGENVIRPPGVPSEDSFMMTCLRCGECMKVCPTNGLQPVWLESGLEGLWTPRLVPRIGNCEFTCTKCGQACPSNAIGELNPKTKQNTVIGRAAFDHNRCIPWSRGQDCAVCEEQCPVFNKAIRLRPAEFADDTGKTVTVFQPYIVEGLCIGCGTCELVCPVEGRAAVRVTGVPQHIIQVVSPGLLAHPAVKMENGANKKSSPVVPAAATASLFLPPPAMKPNTASSTMEVKKVVAPPLPDGRLPVQLKPLLPRDIPGWQPDGKLRFAIPSTLYDLIDGGAEVYLEYGFVKSLRKDYSKGSDSFLTVDVYYMKDEAAAFGIFSSERSPGEASAGVGRDSAINDNEIKFWQDKYFIKITGDASKQEFIAMAKDISSAIGAVGGGVPELSMRAAGCPKAAANSLLLIRGPLALRRFFFFSDKDIFAFKSGTTGLSYQISGDAKTSAAVMKVKDKKTAPQIAENIKSALKGKGFNPAATGSSAIAGYTYFEKTGKRIGLLVKGDKINIVLVSQD